MKISKQARRDAKQLFRAAHSGSQLDEGRVRQMVDEIVTRKPRGYVAILSHLQRLIKLDLERRSARIESFSPLSPDMQAQVKSSLEQRFGAGLNFTFSQNPSLLGGIRVHIGSDVFDGSVRGKLDQLKEAFEGK